MSNRCRSCNTLLDFKFATGNISMKADAGATNSEPKNSSIADLGSYEKLDPPDVEQLGRSSWTLLHSIASKYPKKPTDVQKQEMREFLTIFSHVYPCSWCAKDFEKFIRENAPKVDSRDEFGLWLCGAHNEVNRKLGKSEFNCNLWTKRWVDGWF